MANASLVATACVVAIGCGGAAATDRASVSELTREVDSLRKVVTVIDVQRTRERVLDELKSAVYLTPGDDGYDILRTQFGAVTLSLSDVQPYANGSRVALRFGNATTATLTGVAAHIEWGSVGVDRMPIDSTQHERDVSFTEPFPFGSWTSVHVTLDGIPPTGLGFVRVRDLRNSGIQLSVR